MPNNIRNYIRLIGDKERIDALLEHIKRDEYGIGTIDFNKIIPMPESLNIESGSRTTKGLTAYREFLGSYSSSKNEEAPETSENIPIEREKAYLLQRKDIERDEWELGKIAWKNMQQYGFPTWYEWSIKNWGTKWNAYGYEEGIDYSKNGVLCFQTAWTAPHPILQKLSELYPDITVEHSWADENLGVNCGEFVYFYGGRTDEYIPEGIQAMEYALDLWKHDPTEYDLVKNSMGTAYLNTEVEEFQLIEVFGRPALFTNDRLTAQDVPQGLYYYHLRHSDDIARFCSVEPNVVANHGGSIIIDEPLDFGEDGYISFSEETEPNFLGEDMTLGGYLRREFEYTQDNGIDM